MGALTGAAANTGRRARTHTRGHAVLIYRCPALVPAPAATPSIESSSWCVDLTGGDWTAGGVGLVWAGGVQVLPRPGSAGALLHRCEFASEIIAVPGPPAPCVACVVVGVGDRRRVPRRVMGTLVADTSRPTCLPSPARTHTHAHAQVPHGCTQKRSPVPHARTHARAIQTGPDLLSCHCTAC